MVLDELAERFKAGFKTGGVSFLLAEATRRFPVVMVKPTSYMNLSGRAAREIVAKKGLLAEEVLVIHDDLDLPFGKLRLRKGGSAGGHNGLADIIERLGTDQIARMRIGIGLAEKPQGFDGADFVLSEFDDRERAELPAIIAKAASAAELAVFRGFEVAMNEFNKKTETEI